MVVHADEKVAKGAFTIEDLVQDSKDSRHPKPFVEGKHLDRWLPIARKWLEWGTARAPSLFRRPTFTELYSVSEKLLIHRTGGEEVRTSYDDGGLMCNHTIMLCLPWHQLSRVKNNSLKKTARYASEKPPRPDLPQREVLEATSRRFSIKYILAVMNSSVARTFLRANRRSNTDLYPDDWKKLPIPDVGPEKQEPIVALVDQILTARRKDAKADIARLEAEVDRLVSDLYGVNPEQLAALDAAAKKPEKAAKQVAPIQPASATRMPSDDDDALD